MALLKPGRENVSRKGWEMTCIFYNIPDSKKTRVRHKSLFSWDWLWSSGHRELNREIKVRKIGISSGWVRI